MSTDSPRGHRPPGLPGSRSPRVHGAGYSLLPDGSESGSTGLAFLSVLAPNRAIPQTRSMSSELRFCLRNLRLLVVLGAAAALATASAALEAVRLRCDSAENPLGVDSSPPRLSWQLQSGARGARQTAWQVRVATSRTMLDADRGDVWDSGRRPGDDQLHVTYGGRPLRSSEQVYWKVRVWDRDGQAGPWSEPATWTMGVLTPGDWQARWITDPELLRWVRPKVGYRSLETSDDKEPKWVGVDLGQPRLITAVRIYPMRQVIQEAQGLPLRFVIQAADTPEFSNPTIIADHSNRDFSYGGAARRTTGQTLAAPAGGVTARYVRLVTSQLKRDGPVSYLALSQLEVIAEGRNVAARCPVIARDSLESDR